jgi:hypothetical protein
MKDQIRDIAKGLQQANHAFESLSNLGFQILLNLESMNSSFDNLFQISRIINDQFRAQCAIQSHENEKLLFIATKILSEPKLIDKSEVEPYLISLGTVDASLRDGKHGRPIVGFMHPTISETIADLLEENLFDELRLHSSWDDWNSSFQRKQSQLQRLIELFPIEHPFSTIFVSLQLSLSSIVQEISEQKKIETTLHSLIQHSNDVLHAEHAAYFRLHTMRLERQLVPLPIRDRESEEE